MKTCWTILFVVAIAVAVFIVGSATCPNHPTPTKGLVMTEEETTVTNAMYINIDIPAAKDFRKKWLDGAENYSDVLVRIGDWKQYFSLDEFISRLQSPTPENPTEEAVPPYRLDADDEEFLTLEEIQHLPGADVMNLITYCCEPPYPKDWNYCPYCGQHLRHNRFEREMQRLEAAEKGEKE